MSTATSTVTSTATNRDLIVIGASGGGIDALRRIVGGLPRDLPAAVAVVIHQWQRGPNVLPEILRQSEALAVTEAADGMTVRPGTVYVAPLDHHLLVEAGSFRVSHGPRENRVRPAIDPLFRSAARVYGPRVVGVVLTGSLDDGTAGLLAIKRRGGVAVVQDPRDALYPGMPQSALDYVSVDHCVPLGEVPPLLVDLTRRDARPRAGNVKDEDDQRDRNEILEQEGGAVGMELVEALGDPSVFSCPDCEGALWQVKDGTLVRYRCHTGHAFGLDSLASGKDHDVEAALWIAVRALKEKREITRRMAERASAHGRSEMERRHAEEITALERQISELRTLIDAL
jgi:two-component system chemotaxis response regulator CheB